MLNYIKIHNNPTESLNALVIGTGKSGISAMEVLFRIGYKVTMYDDKNRGEVPEDVPVFIGELPLLHNFSIAVISPGISLDTQIARHVVDSGVELIGEIELAYRVTKAKFISITGTNGKTTTTSWVGDVFKRAGIPSRVIGNIGQPASIEALEASENEILIAELSSYQLETVSTFKSEISCILNITEDHLQRHRTMEEYTRCKSKIISGKVILPYSLRHMYQDAYLFSADEIVSKGAFIKDGFINIVDENINIRLIRADEVSLLGKHNLENALAMVIFAYLSGIDKNIIVESLTMFGGVEHRIEFVSEINGLSIYNDSKATNPDSTIKAIEAFEGKHIHLILGGSEKNSDYSEMFHLIKSRDIMIYLVGDTKNRMMSELAELGKSFESCDGIASAVRQIKGRAKAGDVLLFSPACASFDAFKNFEERGKFFKEVANDEKN